MTRENPNPAAFFFDDGDFLNLEDVQATQWNPDGVYGNDDNEGTDDPCLDIVLRGAEAPFRRWKPAEDELQRLSSALRTYHSKF